MRTTTYKCDRCGKEDITNEIDILNVGVHVGGYLKEYAYGPQDKPRVEFNQEWCLDCRIKTGLKEKPKGYESKQIPLTLEDLVREIAYEASCDAIVNMNRR
jgi:hypothetical protein